MAHTEVYSPPRPPPSGLGEHVARTLSLAVPVMFARVGILLLVAVDTAMTGHFGAISLAHYGLAMAPQVFMLLIGIGLLMGTAVLTAQAEGAGESSDTGRVLRVALVHAALYGAVLAALCYAGEDFLLLTGQDPGLAEGAGRVLVIFGWGLPGMFLYTATVFFLEGINRPVPGMVVMIAANVLNLFLNWLMIFGHWGFSAGGAEGAALATTIVRWCMFFLAASYVLMRVDYVRYGLRGAIPNLRVFAKRFRRIGYPLGIAHGLETSAFSTMTLFAGLLGAVQVAGYMIAMNLISLVFMCALGFATAASVRVGNAVGRGDAEGVRLAGWVAVGIASAFLVAVGIVFFSAPEWLTAIYTSEASVAAVAAPTVLVAAFVLLPDGAQGVLMGALRGASDVWPATFLYLLSFWGVMIPTGYVIGVLEERGAPGLMGAVLVSTACALVLLGIRFHRVTRRAVKRA
ncbi:MAG: MATE family efflux transporter [Gammaproteobacteria bacterium]|nr:MATE family efflux transporter [Gammaproteobacteria bacterium]